jgi:hypothetical protein
VTAADGAGRIGRSERIARAAVGMPALHPELLTRRPGRVEWQLFAAWCAELWPHDEYTAIAAETWRKEAKAAQKQTDAGAGIDPGPTERRVAGWDLHSEPEAGA